MRQSLNPWKPAWPNIEFLNCDLEEGLELAQALERGSLHPAQGAQSVRWPPQDGQPARGWPMCFDRRPGLAAAACMRIREA